MPQAPDAVKRTSSREPLQDRLRVLHPHDKQIPAGITSAHPLFSRKGHFPTRENRQFAKMKNQHVLASLQETLSQDAELFSPLRVEQVELQPLEESVEDLPAGDTALLTLAWRQRRIPCVVMAQGQATPRKVRNLLAHDQLRSPLRVAAEPLILVPYLSAGIAQQLERFGFSGIDLNGNYLILTSDLVAVRLDRPNEYPESRDIKKIYSYNSSIVGRFLLTTDRTFEQVKEIDEGISERGGGISLSTVSKVLKGLNEDMIISKTRDAIRLLQPRKLLDRLCDGYHAPRVDRELMLKLPTTSRDALVTEALGEGGWTWSGDTSAEAYAATTPPGVRVAYTRRIHASRASLREFEDTRFYNCVLKQTNDDFVYFDSRRQWASPIETYLALMQLDKREREIAQRIREDVILAEFASDG